ncbi:MAG: hypothetical protein FJX80_12055 [Bacteroidetes bacterium]|nr:hypothetical protein [Bacteroidota bacterium]
MDNIFSTKYQFNKESIEKINLDELYESKKQEDLAKLYIFNRILSRIHDKIKVAARQKNNQQFCWYLIPEMMLGVPNYDKNACITFVISKLEENEFIVRYTDPNLLLISWKHYIPNYIRNEIKKKTGNIIDKFGNYVSEDSLPAEEATTNDVNSIIFNKPAATSTTVAKKTNSEYKSISSYKPTGNLIYSQELLKKIEEKV